MGLTSLGPFQNNRHYIADIESTQFLEHFFPFIATFRIFLSLCAITMAQARSDAIEGCITRCRQIGLGSNLRTARKIASRACAVNGDTRMFYCVHGVSTARGGGKFPEKMQNLVSVVFLHSFMFWLWHGSLCHWPLLLGKISFALLVIQAAIGFMLE